MLANSYWYTIRMIVRSLKYAFVSILIVSILETLFVLGWYFGTHDINNFVMQFASNEQEIVFNANKYSKDFYDHAYLNLNPQKIDGVGSIISAHHLVVANKIAELFSNIADDDIETIIILSPNHFDQGNSSIQTTIGSWETYYGTVSANKDVIEDLMSNIDIMRIEDSTFENEHGISSLIPFIAKSLPNARIVPLVVHDSMSDIEREALSNAIVKVTPDSLVVASMDISHYLPQNATDFHDEITLRAIEQGNIENLKPEIDANIVLDLLMRINALRSTQKWQMSYHDSSLSAGITDNYLENTSHILGYFTQGEPRDDAFASLHFVGDIMLDREVRAKIDEFGQDYPWEMVERFLAGTHFTIGNLEGTVNELQSTYTANPPFRFVFSPESVEKMHEFIDIVNLANNHASDVGSAGVQETKDRLDEIGISRFGSYSEPTPSLDLDIDGIAITLIGYHQFASSEDDLIKTIREADDRARFVIVVPHWGIEYQVAPSTYQKELAQIMIDAGADLIIGGHPHVVQGIEIIDDVPVVYSLGNFIFDQTDPETYPALTAGVIIDDNSIKIYLLPVWTQNSQPTPMSDKEADELLSEIADFSTESIMTEIKNGVITTIYNK